MDQEQIRLLSSALEAAGNGVIITNLQGEIQWANPAFSRLCGYSNEELLGRTPCSLKSGQQSTEYYQALWAAISHGENWSSETVERAKNGSLYTVLQSITLIKNEEKLTHFIAIHEDISAQKMTQERILALASVSRVILKRQTQKMSDAACRRGDVRGETGRQEYFPDWHIRTKIEAGCRVARGIELHVKTGCPLAGIRLVC
jgi:PAS domain S-box-containing protein